METIICRLTTNPAALELMSDEETIEGYWDGRENSPAPGANRSDAYVQGWWAGMRDGGHRKAHPIDSAIAKAGLQMLRHMKA